MNIFKILANGDGTINEANVSAFLAYLLDPKADHTLEYEFLDQFLESIFGDENFNTEKYDYEIFLEQAFKEEDKSKNIVDIVIICYSIEKGTSKESLVKRFLENTKTIHKVVIIENKIRASSISPGQLLNQFTSTKYELSDNLAEEIYSVYLTPDHDSLVEEFKTANIKKSNHIFWKSNRENIVSVNSMLKDIIKKESIGDIEPISPYTLHTLKAFCKFIENDFKSIKQEQKDRKNDYTYTNRCIGLNNSSKIEEKLATLKSELLKQNANLIISEPILKRICEPELIVNYNNIGISLYAGHKSRDTVMLIFRTLIDNAISSKESLVKFADKINVEIKKPNSKTGSYCKVDELSSRIKINEPTNVFENLQQAIDLLERNI